MKADRRELDRVIVAAVNNELEEDFIDSIEATSDRKVIVNTVDYGSVTYSYEEFFGEPVGSAHDLIKYEVYNRYLEEMNNTNSTLYEVLDK